MRKIQLIATAIMLVLFAMSGCTPSANTGPTFYMTATISGAPSMNTTQTVAAVVGGALSISGTTVTGGVGGPPIIALNIYDWNGGTGTTVFEELTGAVNKPFAQYTQATGSMSKMSNSGSMTITAVTATAITGTFLFTTTDGTTITAGTFNAQRY